MINFNFVSKERIVQKPEKYQSEYRTLYITPKVNRKICDDSHLCKLKYEFHWHNSEVCLDSSKYIVIKSLFTFKLLLLYIFRNVKQLLSVIIMNSIILFAIPLE